MVGAYASKIETIKMRALQVDKRKGFEVEQDYKLCRLPVISFTNRFCRRLSWVIL